MAWIRVPAHCATQMMGELLRKNPYFGGNPRTFPEGWLIGFNAMGTKAQNADLPRDLVRHVGSIDR